MPIETCTLDDDTMEKTFTLTSLELPQSKNVGFNIDGVASLQGSGPAFVSGCGQIDGTGGVDNQLADILGPGGTLGPLLEEQAGVNINDALQSAVDDGVISFNITIGHWNGEDSDDCVSVTITGSGGGTDIELEGRAPLVNRAIAEVRFTPERLDISPTVNIEGAEEPVTIDISIFGARARASFDAGFNNLVTTGANGTAIGGYIRYLGSESDGAFQPVLAQLIEDLGFGSAGDAAHSIFLGALDLRTNPTLAACTGDGTVGRDSLSAAISAGASAE